MKRWIDFPLSVIIVIFLAPVFALVALLIFCSSPGNVFYSQPRLGKKGRSFKCYKFRSMYLDADHRLKDLLERNLHFKDEWEVNQKLKDDPRIFPLGKILRKFSLDELPQLFNVIKGELSLVGPRPYMVKQERLLGPYRNKILSINPGITGLWQTSGRSRTTFQQRMALDALYVDRKSLMLDLLLMIKTVPVVLFNDDAC